MEEMEMQFIPIQTKDIQVTRAVFEIDAKKFIYLRIFIIFTKKSKYLLIYQNFSNF